MAGPSVSTLPIWPHGTPRVVESRLRTSRQILDGIQSNCTHSNRSEERNDNGGKGAGEKSTSSVVNYEISRSVEHLASSVGNIKKLSVAVMVDGSYTTDKKGVRTYVPRPAEELQKLRNIVKNAVGTLRRK